MKFKIEFTGQAELLFSMMAKLLPDDLHVHVEEILDAPPGKTQSIIEKLITHKQLPKPKENKQKHFKHPSGKTVQDFVVEYLKDRPSATWAEMSHHIVSLNYNKSSINNAVTRLVYKKMVEKVATGVYRLTKHARTINHT